MTDNKIIKALECCGNIVDSTCKKCVYHETYNASCVVRLMRDALDLINRQKAEIEGLEETRYELACIIDELLMCMAEGKETKSAKPIDINEIKSEAIKEFAERLKCGVPQETGVIRCADIDNLVKEMTEEEINQRKEDEGK